MKTFLKIIKQTLGSGKDVLISGFGKFCVKDKRERQGSQSGKGNEPFRENEHHDLLVNGPAAVLALRQTKEITCSQALSDIFPADAFAVYPDRDRGLKGVLPH